MSDAAQQTDLILYYAARAREYDCVYEMPERVLGAHLFCVRLS